MDAEEARARLIDVALGLFTTQGYEATTVDQIAAAAELTPLDSSRFIATKDAVILSIIEATLQVAVAALADVPPEMDVLDALAMAHVAVLPDVAHVSTIEQQRMLAMVPIVAASPDLQKKASARRNAVLSRAVGDRIGVEPDDRRVRSAVHLWSAVVAGFYSAGRGKRAGCRQRGENATALLLAKRLNDSFAHITGRPPL